MRIFPRSFVPAVFKGGLKGCPAFGRDYAVRALNAAGPEVPL